MALTDEQLRRKRLRRTMRRRRFAGRGDYFSLQRSLQRKNSNEAKAKKEQ